MASTVTSHVMWEGPDDVLLKIFSYLDADDLISCGDTCFNWQGVLFNEQVWKRALELKVGLNNRWRIVCELLAKNGELKGVCYRDQCKIISRKSQIIQNNWLSGKHWMDTIIHSQWGNQVCGWSRYVDMDADSLLLIPVFTDGLRAYEISTMTTIYEYEYDPSTDFYFRIFKDQILCARENSIVMFNFKKGTQLELPNLGEVEGAFFGTRNRLITLSNYQEMPDLTIWQKKGDGYDVMNRKHFEGFGKWTLLGMDDVYIAIVEVCFDFFQVHFIAVETLEVERSLYLKTRDCQYESGLFFIIQEDFLTVIDVTSGEVLKRIHQKLHLCFFGQEFPIKLNSQFLVLAVEGEINSVFSIYKLEDVKNPHIDVLTPVTEIDVPITLIGKIYVDDSKIIAMQRCNEQVLLVDFFRYKKPCSIEIHVNFD